MRKFVKLFQNHDEYSAYTQNVNYILPNVSFCRTEREVHYEKYIKPSYLTFVAEEPNSTIKLNRTTSSVSSPLKNASLQYSLDNGETWNDYTYTSYGYAGSSGKTITLSNIGDSVKFKGKNNALAINASNFHRFLMTGKISANGDVTSLLNEVGSNIALTDYCFAKLFSGCTSLTTSPQLPSTTLADYCYEFMFSNCPSLTAAPELPATNLSGANSCYYYMFQGCASLTTPPELPAKNYLLVRTQQCFTVAVH